MDRKRRIVIENVNPEVDGGKFSGKAVCNKEVTVTADVFVDGHRQLSCRLYYGPTGADYWESVSMEYLGNDRWQGTFIPKDIGEYRYTIKAWVDRFGTWKEDLLKKYENDQDLQVYFKIGESLVTEAIENADDTSGYLKRVRDALESNNLDPKEKVEEVTSDKLEKLMNRYLERHLLTEYSDRPSITVDRKIARFSAWYELFPRSCGAPETHGTFEDCSNMIPYVKDMGFDVLYLPPIHPIGRTNRKGKNNALEVTQEDPGSPWAIGAEEGGHKSVHPKLGTLEDFRDLVEEASEHDMEVALDIAFQCSPDHPYVESHPEWFRHRPDGSIQYAENPPKKYEDIYPFDFETDDWQALWRELKSIFDFWIDQGVKIFRVDNPHTKPLNFWEWVIAEIKKDHPEVIFLSEAFTRPSIMYYLAKVGFSQSYTYFAWRNTSEEIREYMTELTGAKVSQFFRPNLWPNTPDILTEYLQRGGEAAFKIRFILAATLGSNYGIYGPAFELMENQPLESGSEEYMNSEKYEVRNWEIEREDSLRDLIKRVNEIRKKNPALHSFRNLEFHDVDNNQLLCYSKVSGDGKNKMLIVLNVDHSRTQSGWVNLNLDELDIDGDKPFQVHDLIRDAHYQWQGASNYVELNPNTMPAHVFRVRQLIRSEEDYDYFA
ncbi:MAG: alpha-1,4-glucan--maltose-1-phosphate maltosyltransferase [Candidatus Bipolaricaulia bacterium]